jgi:hypothetical protein
MTERNFIFAVSPHQHLVVSELDMLLINLKCGWLTVVTDYTIQLHWSTKILAHEDKCLFLMYFWTPNSNMFPEFLDHPHLLCCI